MDRNETEVAVIPNQSAPRWKVTTLTARGKCRRASRDAATLGGGAIRLAPEATILSAAR